MKRSSIIFLQIVIVLIGIGALAFLLWEPHLEGRNARATLFEIYFKDPFLAYAYIASIPFFVALGQAFKVLGYAGQDKVFSPAAVKALRTIKYCALAIIGFVAGAEGYLIIFQRRVEKDIAGGAAMGLVMIFISVVVAAAAAVFERIVQNAVDIKSENDLTKKMTEIKKDENCGTRNFEEKENKIVELTQKSLSVAYPIYWTGLNLVKDVINLLIEDATNAIGDQKKYSMAYLMLLNRSIQHIESIRLLTERGFYGDSFVILRSLMSDLSMMQYLHFHPELLDLFLNEKQEDYQDNKEFKKAFSESAVEKDLVERGVKPFGSAFQMLSKASHASSFGSQFYGSRGKKEGQYHFNYGPKYQPEKSLMLVDLVVSSHYDLVTNILWHKYHAKEEIDTDEWNKVKNDLKELKGKVSIHTEVGKKTIKALFPELDEKIK